MGKKSVKSNVDRVFSPQPSKVRASFFMHPSHRIRRGTFLQLVCCVRRAQVCVLAQVSKSESVAEWVQGMKVPTSTWISQHEIEAKESPRNCFSQHGTLHNTMSLSFASYKFTSSPEFGPMGSKKERKRVISPPFFHSIPI